MNLWWRAKVTEAYDVFATIVIIWEHIGDIASLVPPFSGTLAVSLISEANPRRELTNAQQTFSGA